MSELEHTSALRRAGIFAPGAAAALARRTVGIAALAGIVVCAGEVVVGAAAGPSPLVPASAARFPSWISGVLHDVGGTTLSENAYTAWMVAMLGCYLAVLALVRSLSMRAVATTVVLLHVLLALAPPLDLTDIFNYLGFARLGVVHGLNPYSHAVIAVPGDPVVPFDSWRHLHSPYGPLFTLLTYAIAPLGLAAGVWLLKAAAAVLSLGCVALLAWCARRLGRDPRAAVALMGLNPVVVIFGVGGGHNDFLMLLLVIGGIALTISAREPLGAVATIAAAGVKASAAILFPFELLGTRSGRRRATLLAGAATAVAGLAISFAVFGPAVLNGVRSQAQCVSKLSVPDTLGRIVGAGGAVTSVHVVLVVAFAGVFVWQLTRTRPGRWVTPAGWATLALLAALTWLMPWYIAWALPLAALSDSRRFKIAVLIALVYSMLIWLPPITSAISRALPAATPHLAGGCTRGVQQVERHPGWATGFR